MGLEGKLLMRVVSILLVPVALLLVVVLFLPSKVNSAELEGLIEPYMVANVG
jgi:hypothetical protein